jgi:DNA-binding SARP family transcriptional activator
VNGKAALALAAFQSAPFGLLVLDYQRRAVVWNESARDLLGVINAGDTCCDLLGCGTSGEPLSDGCLTELARSQQRELPEVRIDVATDGGDGAVWITAAPLAPEHEYVVVHLRPGEVGDRRRRTIPHWTAGPELRVRTLGRTLVESREGPIAGNWIDRRTGQMLKLLVTERRRVVHTDEIVEALWHQAGVSDSSKVRFLVHSLRHKIEPDRQRGQSHFIIARNGGYTLDSDRVRIDADEFELHVRDSRAALARGDEAAAERSLSAAVELYGGDFLVDEPYAEWVLAERDRLRGLMSEALTGLAELRSRDDDIGAATSLAERHAAMQPYDMEVQRQAVEMMLRAGRRSDAVRHYEALRQRMLDVFEEEPSFTLPDVAALPDSPPAPVRRFGRTS